MRDLARTYTADAIEALARIMGDESQPPAARVSAAVALLDRGWGKANQTVEHNAGRSLEELVRASLQDCPEGSP